MPRQTLEVEELLNFKNTESIMYARCSETKREMRITLNGGFQILKNKELKHETMNAANAVKLYNEL